MNKKRAVWTITISILIVLLLSVAYYFFYNNSSRDNGEINNDRLNRFFCNSDSDCVPESCCHPTSCVSSIAKPDCSAIICTADCQPGTLDCNQASCRCIENKCKFVLN